MGDAVEGTFNLSLGSSTTQIAYLNRGVPKTLLTKEGNGGQKWVCPLLGAALASLTRGGDQGAEDAVAALPVLCLQGGTSMVPGPWGKLCEF